MEVRDVFELRKKGQTEQAYEAICPMFDVHQGHYTSLAMLWTANDMFAKYFSAGRLAEARQALMRMVRAAAHTEDDGKANAAIVRCALKMDSKVDGFNLEYFIPFVEKLKDDDWKASQFNGHYMASLGQRAVDHLMKPLAKKGRSYVERVMPLFTRALEARPSDKNNLRHLAQVYAMSGQRDKATGVYIRLLQRYHDPYLYSGLAAITDDHDLKVALLCMAVMRQKRDVFSAGLHGELAFMLRKRAPARAAFEARKSLALRKQAGWHASSALMRLSAELSAVEPVSLTDEQAFYQRAAAYCHDKLHL